MTCGSRSSRTSFRTCALASLPMVISSSTDSSEIAARPVVASTNIARATPCAVLVIYGSCAGRCGSRHVVGPPPAKPRIGGCEFDAVHEDDRRDVDPEQKH